MKEKVLEIIESLNGILIDLEKVDNHAYGYKAAAVRARKVLHESRKEFQAKKNEE